MRNRKLGWLLAALFLTGFVDVKKPVVSVELSADPATVKAGGTARLNVHFTIQDDWHIYAQEPGEAGLPTKVALEGPPEVTFAPLKWPRPERLVDPGDIKTFGYTSDLTLSSDMTVSPTAASPVPIHAKVEWLACRNLCVPGSVELDLALPVTPAS